MSEVCEHAYGGPGPCPHCRCAALEAELVTMRSELEHRKSELRRVVGLAGYAVTCRKINTSPWMMGLLDYFRAAFPGDRFHYDIREGMITHRPGDRDDQGWAAVVGGAAAPTSGASS